MSRGTLAVKNFDREFRLGVHVQQDSLRELISRAVHCQLNINFVAPCEFRLSK